MQFAALTGLVAEARLLERRGIRAAAAAAREPQSVDLCARLIAEGATALLSFGLAGGLAPGLGPGTLLLPCRVLDSGDAHPVDPDWRRRVEAALGAVADARDLLGRAALAVSGAEKAALHRQSGAVAIDLESHIVARAARRARCPFLVLRAVADPAEFSLPPAALVGLAPNGRIALGAVMHSLAAHPGQLPAVLRLARSTRLALRALARAADAL